MRGLGLGAMVGVRVKEEWGLGAMGMRVGGGSCGRW